MKKSKKIIILGSEGALGNELVNQLQKQNFTIIAVDQNEKSGLKNVDYFRTDFADEKQVAELSKFLMKNLDDENVIISTIGKFGDDYGDGKADFESLTKSLQINLLGIAKISLELSNHAASCGKKIRFVLTGSAAGSVGSRDFGYGIAKAGLNGLILSLSKSFAQKNITAIGVNPGIFSSKMSENVAAERQKFAINQTHLKRAGAVSEIANVILYSALEAPDFMTGSLINVNGGQYS